MSGVRGGRRAARQTRAPRRFRGLPARRLRLLVPLAVLVVAGFLYAQPLARYVETRRDVAAREAEVAELRLERKRLETRLERSTSLLVLSRDARRLGLVRPGEQLFIVKGIPAWRRSGATVSDDGGP